MRIGIIADTHDHGPNMLVALELFKWHGVRHILHAGDWASPTAAIFFDSHRKNLGIDCPVDSVFGNNDGDRHRFHTCRQLETGDRSYAVDINYHIDLFRKELDGRNVAMYHGDNPHITDALLLSQAYDLLVTGHDHNAQIRQLGRTAHINPGSVNGLYLDFLVTPSVAIYDTRKKDAEILFFKDLGAPKGLVQPPLGTHL